MAERAEELGRRFRLRSSVEFNAVYATRRSLRTRDFIICLRRNGIGHARLGLSVSRKVGNAVVRNRVKRVLREVFRRNRHRVPGDFDLVFIPKSSASIDDYESARLVFMDLMQRLKRKTEIR